LRLLARQRGQDRSASASGNAASIRKAIAGRESFIPRLLFAASAASGAAEAEGIDKD
jgi:hypothetical protein